MIFSDLFFLFAFLPAFFLCYLLAAVGDKLYIRSKYSWQDAVKTKDCTRCGYKLKPFDARHIQVSWFLCGNTF